MILGMKWTLTWSIFDVLDGKTKIRAAFEHAGAVLDSGNSRLIFPSVDHDLHLIQLAMVANFNVLLKFP
jgi:hypothetical protein